MAAVTSTIMAAGGLALSAKQMVDANKNKQSADQAAKIAAATIKGTKQANAFQALQAPDVASLAEQTAKQTQAQSVQALQEMGPEGAAQIANIDQNARAAGLQAAQAQGQVNFQRDAMQAQAQQGINEQQYATETALATSQLEGAQAESRGATAAKNQAIAGMFGAAGQAITGIGQAAPLYRKQKQGAPTGTATTGDMSYAPGATPPVQGENAWQMYGQNTMPITPGSVVVQ